MGKHVLDDYNLNTIHNHLDEVTEEINRKSEIQNILESMKNHPAGKQVPIVPFDEMVYKYFGDSADLLLRKHRDYGPKNISLAPGGAVNGLRVRIWDKVARINNLIDKGVEPENESLKDSFQDLANYAIIAMIALDGKWPKE